MTAMTAAWQRGWRWCYRNLFNSPLNTCLTLGLGVLVAQLVPQLFNWAVFEATFQGSSQAACQQAGACWVFIKEHLNQFLFGFYPRAEQYRVLIAAFWGLASLLPFANATWRRRPLLVGLTLFMALGGVFALIAGGFFNLPAVETAKWGGLMLTILLSLVGIVVSLPLGILLALARRSRMPFLRAGATIFIEVCRGVPLITVLFMSSVMLPLFLPRDFHYDKLLRALTGITLFAAAYMAEVVRGGLQMLAPGQTEAAQALGLSYWQIQRLIVLPQALKIVIPGIVNTFIGLFKDTSLVMIIGMFDLLGIVQAASTHPDWLGNAIEGYVFVGLCFFVACYAMSKISQYWETRLQIGRRAQGNL